MLSQYFFKHITEIMTTIPTIELKLHSLGCNSLFYLFIEAWTCLHHNIEISQANIVNREKNGKWQMISSLALWTIHSLYEYTYRRLYACMCVCIVVCIALQICRCQRIIMTLQLYGNFATNTIITFVNINILKNHNLKNE